MTIWQFGFEGSSGVALENVAGNLWDRVAGSAMTLTGDGEGSTAGTAAGTTSADANRPGSDDQYAKLDCGWNGVSATTQGPQLGPMVRFPDATGTAAANGYIHMMEFVTSMAANTARSALRISSNNSRTTLTSFDTFAYTPGAARVEIEIRVEGSTVRGYRDGVLVHEITNTSIPSGPRCGIYAFTNSGWNAFDRFDNFELGALSDLTPPPASPWSVVAGVNVPMDCLGVVSGGALVPLTLEHP